MPAGRDIEDITGLLDSLRSSLQQVRSAQAVVEPEPVTVSAADGLVRVTASRSGQVDALELDPRAMRWDSQTLAEEILRAVNAAQSAQQGLAGQAAAPADLAVLTEQIGAVQDASTRQMRGFIEAITDVQRRLTNQSTARPADPA